MSEELKRSADAILQQVVSAEAPVAGVAAVATDRNGSIYEGAAGVRTLGSQAPFTTDTVCAIFSTTKAIAGTVALMLMQEGSLDMDAPAKEYAPALGRGAGSRRVRAMTARRGCGRPTVRSRLGCC